MGHLNRPPKMHKSDQKFALVQSVDLKVKKNINFCLILIELRK